MGKGKSRKGKTRSTANAATGATKAGQAPARAPSQDHTKRPRQFRVLGTKILTAIAALATIVAGGGYAVQKWHETIAAIDLSGDVDQQKPFTFPFNIKNQSSFFDIHGAKVACKFFARYNDGGSGDVISNGGTYGIHGTPLIAAGETSVFFCDFLDKFTMTNNDTGKIMPLKSAEMTVDVDYEIWLPWTVSRRVAAIFTLLNTSKGYRWMKGTQIK